MREILLAFFIFWSSANGHAQSLQRPKLVVGIVVDQMRWDFLYRFADRYADNGGFNRLLREGFACENTMIPFVPTNTGSGHAGIYTGTVPAINGITGNGWFDADKQDIVNCTDDADVQTVGSESNAGKMSPKRLMTSTICDELKLATNFRSKTIGIALKDRGGILPTGHSANAAYWWDSKKGDWISSSYYMQQLPSWVNDFNRSHFTDRFFADGWNTLYPISTYTQSTVDQNNFEVHLFGQQFPYAISNKAGTSFTSLLSTPFGNTLTTAFAKACIINEQLGADSIADFLTISYSSTDYIGHAFGPNSIEMEDTYLRLDIELGEFVNFLDAQIGKGQYLLFLTSDHGAAHVPHFLNENKMSGGYLNMQRMLEEMNEALTNAFDVPDLVLTIVNNQIVLDEKRMAANSKLDKQKIENFVIAFLKKQTGIANAFTFADLPRITMNEWQKKMIVNSYYHTRCGQIYFVLQPQWIEGFEDGGSTHGLWNPYDAHIPLLWYGWKVPAGASYREVSMIDIAPTLAAMLHIQQPNGSVGTVITELLK